MSFDVASVSGRNSSALVAYYLRTTETGWYVATDVLKDAKFRESLGQMIEDKASVMHAKVEKYGASSKAVPIEDRLECLRKRVPKSVGGGEVAQQLVQTVHKAGLSLLLDRVDARTGRAFQIQLPNSSVGNVEQIAKQIRDLFPSNVPMMVTIHTGDKNRNLHLQGWFCERAWDADKLNWSKPLDQFRTKAGLSEFRSRIDAVLAECGAVWKHDPNAPKRTVFHPAKSQFMKSLSHEELLKGNFLKDVQNPKLRACLTEEVEIARYFDSQRSGAQKVQGGSLDVYKDLELFASAQMRKEQVASMSNADVSESKLSASDVQEQSIRAELETLTARKSVRTR